MPARRWTCALATLVCALGARGSGDAGADGRTRSVQLFRSTRTHLEFTREGAAILRNAPRPFCIVSIVGPTRTGKSSLLGRCFADRQSFEVGADLFSKTAGVWISDRPLILPLGEGASRRDLAVYLVDTEGFHGVLQQTSRSFEANMFAAVRLMSACIIYNTRAPLDAKDVERLRAFASTTRLVRRELAQRGLAAADALPRPAVVWAVQGMNFRQLERAIARLEPGGAAPSEGAAPSAPQLRRLLAHLLRGASDGGGGGGGSEAEAETVAEGSAAEGAGAGPRDGAPDGAPLRGVMRSEFASLQLVPLHAPHHDEAVLADLSAAPDARLAPPFVADVRALRATCERALRPLRVGGEELSGEAFYWQLERWLLEGAIHVPEPSLAAAVAEARLRRACVLLLQQYARALGAAEGADEAGADGAGGAEPAVAAALVPAAHAAEDGRAPAAPVPPSLPGALSEPFSALEGRCVRLRTDVCLEFERMCTRWLGEKWRGAPRGGARGAARRAAPSGGAAPGASARAAAARAGPAGRASAAPARADGAVADGDAADADAADADADDGTDWEGIVSRERAYLESKLDEQMNGALGRYASLAAGALHEHAALLCERGCARVRALDARAGLRWSTPYDEVRARLERELEGLVSAARAEVDALAEHWGVRAPPIDELENEAYLKRRAVRAQLAAHEARRARAVQLLRAARALAFFAVVNWLDAVRRQYGLVPSNWRAARIR